MTTAPYIMPRGAERIFAEMDSGVGAAGQKGVVAIQLGKLRGFDWLVASIFGSHVQYNGKTYVVDVKGDSFKNFVLRNNLGGKKLSELSAQAMVQAAKVKGQELTQAAKQKIMTKMAEIEKGLTQEGKIQIRPNELNNILKTFKLDSRIVNDAIKDLSSKTDKDGVCSFEKKEFAAMLAQCFGDKKYEGDLGKFVTAIRDFTKTGNTKTGEDLASKVTGAATTAMPTTIPTTPTEAIPTTPGTGAHPTRTMVKPQKPPRPIIRGVPTTPTTPSGTEEMMKNAWQGIGSLSKLFENTAASIAEQYEKREEPPASTTTTAPAPSVSKKEDLQTEQRDAVAKAAKFEDYCMEIGGKIDIDDDEKGAAAIEYSNNVLGTSAEWSDLSPEVKRNTILFYEAGQKIDYENCSERAQNAILNKFSNVLNLIATHEREGVLEAPTEKKRVPTPQKATVEEVKYSTLDQLQKANFNHADLAAIYKDIKETENFELKNANDHQICGLLYQLVTNQARSPQKGIIRMINSKCDEDTLRKLNAKLEESTFVEFLKSTLSKLGQPHPDIIIDQFKGKFKKS